MRRPNNFAPTCILAFILVCLLSVSICVISAYAGHSTEKAHFSVGPSLYIVIDTVCLDNTKYFLTSYGSLVQVMTPVEQTITVRTCTALHGCIDSHSKITTSVPSRCTTPNN